MDYYVLILFNVKWPNLGNNTDPGWLDYRLEIFRRFTLKSLLDQNDGPFRIWMLCSPESERILDPKIDALKEKYPAMADVDFIFDEEAACASLENNEKPLYFLKIDSDDMYCEDTVKRSRQMLGSPAKISLVMFCNGYIYDLKTGRLHGFCRRSIGTYATVFPAQTFDHDSFRKYLVCDQTKVGTKYNPRRDMSRAVCCLDHEMNLHNDPRRKGLEIGNRTGQTPSVMQEWVAEILKNYGIKR